MERDEFVKQAAIEAMGALLGHVLSRQTVLLDDSDIAWIAEKAWAIASEMCKAAPSQLERSSGA